MTTQERILEGAVQIFARKGYSNASVKEIAQKADVNTLTVFRYFHDKETLFLQAVEQMRHTSFDGEALNRLLTYQDIQADLLTIGKAYLREIFESLPLIRIYIGDSLNFDQLKEERWFISPVLKEHFASYIASLQQAGGQAKEHAQLLAEMWVATITRWTLSCNKRKDVWKVTNEIEASFCEEFIPQAHFMAYMIEKK
jgi:AcrR family transcriptional regulator